MLSIAQSIFVLCYCNEPRQATTWYGFQYYHPYPYEEHAPVITNLTYSLEGDTLIKDKQYRQIRCYTNESEHITAYRGAIRQSEDRQQVYFVPGNLKLNICYTILALRKVIGYMLMPVLTILP